MREEQRFHWFSLLRPIVYRVREHALRQRVSAQEGASEYDGAEVVVHGGHIGEVRYVVADHMQQRAGHVRTASCGLRIVNHNHFAERTCDS